MIAVGRRRTNSRARRMRSSSKSRRLTQQSARPREASLATGPPSRPPTPQRHGETRGTALREQLFRFRQQHSQLLHLHRHPFSHLLPMPPELLVILRQQPHGKRLSTASFAAKKGTLPNFVRTRPSNWFFMIPN